MGEVPASAQSFSLASSLAKDVWRAHPDKDAYEWWYFDALSDDGRDAVVIIFLDNFIFSPRYNRLCMSSEPGFPSKTSETSRLPALAFFYYRDGKPLYRCINEFTPEEFVASQEKAHCRIGDSEFEFGSSPYGDGYRVTVRGVMQGGQRLEADFEWMTVDGDLGFEENGSTDACHSWNLVTPRADVSGKVRVLGAGRGKHDSIDFRGTGYHDHNDDTRWLPSAVKRWNWGRVHLNDSTVVFYDFEPLEGDRVSRLITVRDATARVDSAKVIESGRRLDVFGIAYPESITFLTEDAMRLTVRNSRPIDSSFFYLRFVNESMVTFPDGAVATGNALTELLAPKALRYRWLDWLVDMRIGRGGRGAFLK